MDLLADTDEEPDDIFENLDVSLMGVFSRNQLREVRRMARINNLRTTDDLIRFIQEHHDRRVFKVHWALGLFPVPILNLGPLRRRHGARSLALLATKLISATITIIFRMIKRFVYFITVMMWLQTILKECSFITFSDNYVLDITTYLLRNYPVFVQARINTLQYPPSDVWESANSTSEGFRQVLVHSAAQLIRVNCTKGPDDAEPQCSLNQNSLIFRFHSVFRNMYTHFEDIPAPLFTTSVVLFYLVYGAVGELILLNFVFHCCMWIASRHFLAFSFLTRLAKLFWLNAKDIVM